MPIHRSVSQILLFFFIFLTFDGYSLKNYVLIWSLFSKSKFYVFIADYPSLKIFSLHEHIHCPLSARVLSYSLVNTPTNIFHNNNNL